MGVSYYVARSLGYTFKREFTRVTLRSFYHNFRHLWTSLLSFPTARVILVFGYPSLFPSLTSPLSLSPRVFPSLRIPSIVNKW